LHTNNRGIERRVPSGGVGILIANRIKDKVKVLKPVSDHVLWCVLEKSLLQQEKDSLLGSVYIPPEKSKYANIEMFTDIEEEVNEICGIFDCYINIILGGDFNSHFGTLSENLSYDDALNKEQKGEIVSNVLSDVTSLEELGTEFL
jgi:hypothetical protein